MQTPNTLNITVKTDVILNVTLEHDGVVLNPALIDNLQANLITGLGRKTPLETSAGIDYIVVNIPWVDGRLPGCYSLEITGSINGLAWSAVGKSIIRYTSATEIGRSTVEVTGDTYDVTMEVGYYFTDSPIEGVSATIDDGVGEPSVETSYIRRQLSFDFHNLRGNGITSIETDEHQGDEAINTVTIKTDLDDEGTDFHVRNGSRGNGIASSSEVMSPDDGGVNTLIFTDDDGNNHTFHSRNGRTGKQGDSAVFDPSTGNIAAIKQTTGDDANSPMSQKAVTEELFVDIKTINISSLTQLYGYCNSNNLWEADAVLKRAASVLVPCVPGRTYRIVGNSNNVQKSNYSFVKSDTLVNGSAPDFAEGVTGRRVIQNDEIIITTAPSGAKFMLIMTLSQSNDVKPSSIKEGGYVRDDVKALNESSVNSGRDMYGDRIILGDYEIIGKYISPSTNQWGASNTYGGVLIPVITGKKMRIITTTYGVNYAFLTSSDTQTGSPSLAGDATWVSTLSANSVVVLDVPSDAVKLYILAKTASGDITGTLDVSTVISSGKQLDNLSQQGAYLKKVNCVEERNLKTINVYGDIIDSGTSGLFLLRKYAIEQGKDYYASVFMTRGRVTPCVAYYDQSESFIGFDNAFGQTGKPLYADRRKMNVPNGAAWVWLMGASIEYNSPYPPQLFEGVWSKNKPVTPYTIEYHIANVRLYPLPSDTDTDPTDGIEISQTMADSPWAVMWPDTYTPNGKPTRVVAMLHGSAGYVTSSVMGYPSSNTDWVAWRKRYLEEGFAVIDINGYGVYTSQGQTHQHYGCPAAIETLDKAFEYLMENYNVCDKMLIHGTSMGGALAQTYAKTYPNKVIAVAAFAPVALIRNLMWRNPIYLSRLFGYLGEDESLADDYKRMVGTIPFLPCISERESNLMQMDWSAIRTEAKSEGWSFEQIDAEVDTYSLSEKFPVPLRIWHGTNDNNVPVGYNKQMVAGYQRGGSLASLRLCDGASHEDVGWGVLPYVVNEAIDFFKRYL